MIFSHDKYVGELSNLLVMLSRLHTGGQISYAFKVLLQAPIGAG